MSPRARLRAEHGYTLIEMIVATGAGLIVAAAALAILATSYHMLANGGDRVDANQQGRIALQRIEQLLNSSCIAGVGVSPIVGGSSAGSGAPPSGADSITFVASQSDSPSAEPSEYVLYLSSGGALDLATYVYRSGSDPDWVFATAPASTVALLSHAALTSGTSAIFNYYQYAASGQLQTTADPLVGGYLPSSSAASVAAVTIQFEALATDNNTSVNNGIDLSDQVVLRLTPVSSTPPTSTPEPCS
jgi:Tfp pilus assembly protein PilW